MSVMQETELRLQKEENELARLEHDREVALRLQVYAESFEIKNLLNH